MKLRVEATDLSTFPDVSVVCGEAIVRIDRRAITNPILLVEVTSRSTEDYDRGDKLSHYKQIPSLRAVLFVSYRSRGAAEWHELLSRRRDRDRRRSAVAASRRRDLRRHRARPAVAFQSGAKPAECFKDVAQRDVVANPDASTRATTRQGVQSAERSSSTASNGSARTIASPAKAATRR